MIVVLLSTYNGARFLREQLDSILAQDCPALRVLIRDDGSKDATPTILREYAAREPRIRLICGENLGVVGSFFKLLSDPETAAAAYVAFSDQDDVWAPDKLSRAVGMLQARSGSTPVLYFSRLTIVDEQLNLRSYSRALRRGPALENALVENVATGCTIVLNAAARSLLVQTLPAGNVYIHDWWIYQVLCAAGEVIYDPESRILYRQHASNTIGVPTGWRHVRRRVGERLSGRHARMFLTQARELEARCGDRLTPSRRRVLDRFLAAHDAWWRRVAYAFAPDVWRQRRGDSLLMRFLLAIGQL